MHKVSVIIPVYNVENYLSRCIDSVLSQNDVEFELILVDDGSTDTSGIICDGYALKDERVRVYHKNNGGVSSARNFGLEKAKGDLVVFVDSDDFVACDYLKELYCALIYTESDLVSISTMLQLDNPMIILSRPEFSVLFSQYKFDKFCPPWGKIFKKDIITQNNIMFNSQIRLGEDLMFVLSYLMHINKITLISSDSYYYERNRAGSLTKVINSYEIEKAGMNEFDRVSNLLFQVLSLNKDAITALEESKKLYIERTLLSLRKFKRRSDRIKILMELDLSLYHKYKKPYSWKENILLLLLKYKCFHLYDFLMIVQERIKNSL